MQPWKGEDDLLLRLPVDARRWRGNANANGSEVESGDVGAGAGNGGGVVKQKTTMPKIPRGRKKRWIIGRWRSY